jgi:tetratricopeptide (TPR) repeat protein
MSRPGGFRICFLLSSLAVSGLAQQAPPKKIPTIIRDTGVAEGKTDAEAAVKKEYSPVLAERNLNIGKFYLKNRNYDAAILRFLDAIEYHPALLEAYDALGRAYEKKGDLGKALVAYRDCIKNNPDSPKVSDFKKRSDRLEKELAKKK